MPTLKIIHTKLSLMELELVFFELLVDLFNSIVDLLPTDLVDKFQTAKCYLKDRKTDHKECTADLRQSSLSPSLAYIDQQIEKVLGEFYERRNIIMQRELQILFPEEIRKSVEKIEQDLDQIIKITNYDGLTTGSHMDDVDVISAKFKSSIDEFKSQISNFKKELNTTKILKHILKTIFKDNYQKLYHQQVILLLLSQWKNTLVQKTRLFSLLRLNDFEKFLRTKNFLLDDKYKFFLYFFNHKKEHEASILEALRLLIVRNKASLPNISAILDSIKQQQKQLRLDITKLERGLRGTYQRSYFILDICTRVSTENPYSSAGRTITLMLVNTVQQAAPSLARELDQATTEAFSQLMGIVFALGIELYSGKEWMAPIALSRMAISFFTSNISQIAKFFGEHTATNKLALIRLLVGLFIHQLLTGFTPTKNFASITSYQKLEFFTFTLIEYFFSTSSIDISRHVANYPLVRNFFLFIVPKAITYVHKQNPDLTKWTIGLGAYLTLRVLTTNIGLSLQLLNSTIEYSAATTCVDLSEYVLNTISSNFAPNNYLMRIINQVGINTATHIAGLVLYLALFCIPTGSLSFSLFSLCVGSYTNILLCKRLYDYLPSSFSQQNSQQADSYLNMFASVVGNTASKLTLKAAHNMGLAFFSNPSRQLHFPDSFEPSEKISVAFNSPSPKRN